MPTITDDWGGVAVTDEPARDDWGGIEVAPETDDWGGIAVTNQADETIPAPAAGDAGVPVSEQSALGDTLGSPLVAPSVEYESDPSARAMSPEEIAAMSPRTVAELGEQPVQIPDVVPTSAPISQGIGEVVDASGVRQPLVTLPKPEVTGIGTGIVAGLETVAEGLTSPENIGLLASMVGAPKVLQQIASAGFTAMMGAGTVEGVKATAAAVQEGQSSGEIAKLATETTLTAAMAGLAGKHAAGRRPISAPERAASMDAAKAKLAEDLRATGAPETAKVVSESPTPPATPATLEKTPTDNGASIVRQGEAGVENDVFSRDGYAYRGITEQEFEATIGSGSGVESRGDFRLPEEGTNFAGKFADAESYVNFGRDDPRKTGKPTYVVEVSRDGLSETRRGDFEGKKPSPPTRVWKITADGNNLVAREITTPTSATATPATTPAAPAQPAPTQPARDQASPSPSAEPAPGGGKEQVLTPEEFSRRITPDVDETAQREIADQFITGGKQLGELTDSEIKVAIEKANYVSKDTADRMNAGERGLDGASDRSGDWLYSLTRRGQIDRARAEFRGERFTGDVAQRTPEEALGGLTKPDIKPVETREQLQASILEDAKPLIKSKDLKKKGNGIASLTEKGQQFIKDSQAKLFDRMTRAANAERLPQIYELDKANLEASHKAAIREAFQEKGRVSSEAADKYELTPPEGYVKRGDLYVYEAQPISGTPRAPTPPTTAAEPAARPGAEATPATGILAASPEVPKSVEQIKREQRLAELRRDEERILQDIDDWDTGARASQGQPMTGKNYQLVRREKIKELTKLLDSTRTEIAAASPKPAPVDVGTASRQAAAPLGILPPNPFIPEAVRNDIPKASVPKAADGKIEARYSAARLEQKSWLERGKTALKSAQESFTRHFIKLDPKTDGAVIDTLRVAESIPQRAQFEAAKSMHGVVQNLGPNKYAVFNRVIVLRDIIKDIDRGLHDSGDLPFGYKSRAEVEADLSKFEATASGTPDIKTALDQRQQLINGMRDELVNRGLLPESVKDYDDYFHRQVLEHYAVKEAVTSGAGRKDARVGEKGFQKGRIGSAKDFNTSYIESEFEVLAQARSQIAMQDALAKIKDSADITPALAAQAKASGKDVDSLIPSDYTKWQPERGNYFYPANTLADKALEAFLKGTKTLTEADFKKAVALGTKKPEWIIPKRLAETLDDMAPPPESAVSKFSAQTISKWKQWTLINPYRVLKYNLNNMSGDLDIALAVDPGILKGAAQAARDSYKARKGTPFPDEADLRRLDVIGSGFSVKEVPELFKHEWFETLEGRRPNVIERYWRSAKNFTQWREDVLRIAAYRRFLERINAGENVYGASKKAEIDAIKDPKERAAKLAREAIGDYGNVSEAGQWIRSHMIPFYSWMEINAPRYYRLMKNLPDEGKSVSRVPAVATWQLGKKATGLSLKAGALYMAATLWNRAFFADEEDELGDAERRQMHLILGRDAAGKIITLRIQGALSDALSWFGGEDLPSDVADVSTGKASMKEKLMDAMKAPAVKLITSSQPIYKTMIETAAGVSLYPDPFNPRPIRDRAEHAARALSVQEVYRRMAGKPRPTVSNDVLSLITYSIDPGEAAYFSTRAMVQDFLEKKGVDKPSVEPTNRQNSLYYYKQAIRYGDKPAAERFLAEYKAAGGKDSGLKSSVQKSSPLNGLRWGGKDYKRDFDNSLTPREKEVVRRAEQWYTKVYR